jgi:hypothetical protein
MVARARRARIGDVHELAIGMPHVTVGHGPQGNPIYQVGGKSFVFFRNPRPDAVDPDTGERYPDVIMFWVTSEADKQALVQDQGSPFFSTPHFDGHPGQPDRRAHGPGIGRGHPGRLAGPGLVRSDRRLAQRPRLISPPRAPGGTTSGRTPSWRRYPSASRS